LHSQEKYTHCRGFRLSAKRLFCIDSIRRGILN